MNLKKRLAIRTVLVLAIVAALLFGPAGSFRFWQGWVFVGVFVVFNAIFAGYFLKHDPGLIERRLKSRETRQKQKTFQIFWLPLWILMMLLPGFDYRYGWSASLGGVPVWLAVAGQVGMCGSWYLIFQVFRINSFASTVIQVETGQKVITSGPYGLVRHPMYSAIVLVLLTLPFAMGSYLMIAPAIFLILLLVYRLKDEESVLRRELPGYVEYSERTKFRLVPGVY